MTDQDPNAVETLREHTCWELLRGASVGRLAVVLDGEPEIFPVNHVVDQGTVVFRTAEGSKLEGANGHRVAFEVDGLDEDSGHAWSVVVKGHAHAMRSLVEVVDSFGLPLEAWQAGPKPIFVRIAADEVSGRRFRPQLADPGGASQVQRTSHE